jgi:hypothetical protein
VCIGGRDQANVTPCFVETFEVGVCQGPYTPELVRAWHKWDKAHGSENDPVDGLQVRGLVADPVHSCFIVKLFCYC